MENTESKPQGVGVASVLLVLVALGLGIGVWFVPYGWIRGVMVVGTIVCMVAYTRIQNRRARERDLEQRYPE